MAAINGSNFDNIESELIELFEQTFSVTEAPIIRPNPPLHGTRHYTAYY
jgi:hypothetical protein